MVEVASFPANENPKNGERKLRIQEIENNDINQCLRLIYERHTLLPNQLFAVELSNDPDEDWNIAEMTKLALMRLESIPAKTIADFYIREFEQLHRREMGPQEDADMEEKIGRLCHKNFSRTLKNMIGANAGTNDDFEMIMQDSEARKVLLQIASTANVKPEEVLSGERLPKSGKFTSTQLLKIFHGRLKNRPHHTVRHSHRSESLSRMTS